MKVILLEDVKALGKKGQVVEVSDGYAKNFILKKKLGLEATGANMNDLKLQKARDEKVAQQQLDAAKEQAALLEEKSVTLSIKAGEGGKAFGSVSSKEIAAAYKEQCNMEIDKKKIQLPATGFDALDHVTAGWQRGDLNILAARPSVGKTAFALHLARAAAMAGRHVVVFSLEMQGERLGDRWLLAATEGVDPQHLRSGQLTPGEVRQVHEASAELSRLPILIDDHPMTSMDRVRSSARLLKSKNRCDMVIVDYLQLCDMRSDQKNRNREQEVAQASRKAKLLAKELDIPVLLLSQLNRASDGTIDHRPTLSNLRESGAIEQDADMVMLLCRPALYGKTVDKKSTYPTDGLGIVIIAKHRNGKTGEVYFHHNQSMTKLVDYIPPLEWLTRNAK